MKTARGVYLHIKCSVKPGSADCGYYTGHFKCGNGVWMLKPLLPVDNKKIVKAFSTKEEALSVAKELLFLFPDIICVSVITNDIWLSDVTRTGVQSNVSC